MLRAPSFPQAKNLRQKARSAGTHPDHWYVFEHASAVPVGKAVEARFWGKTFALFRGDDGVVRCLENRCAHRQIKLSSGRVEGCKVVCPYHGWTYDANGKLVDVPHERFGRSIPNISVATYPVRERYGLIWVFPGDPELADKTPMPEIPELEGRDRWACVPFDYTWNAHHTMIVENTCDFTHETLHRRWQPFSGAKLTRLETVDDRVFVEYDTKVGAGKIFDKLIDRGQSEANHMRLCFDYPHQWSNTDEKYKHWMFVLPIDERSTRCFFVFYYESLKVPYLPVHIPRWLMTPLLTAANRILMKPVLDEDGWAVELEQKGYDRFHDLPFAELSPVVKAFQELTVSRWEAYLASRDSVPRIRRLPVVPDQEEQRAS